MKIEERAVRVLAEYLDRDVGVGRADVAEHARELVGVLRAAGLLRLDDDQQHSPGEPKKIRWVTGEDWYHAACLASGCRYTALEVSPAQAARRVQQHANAKNAWLLREAVAAAAGEAGS